MCAMLRAGCGGRGGQLGSSSDFRSLGPQLRAFVVSWDGKKGGMSSEVGTELCSNVRWHLDALYSLQNQISEMEEVQGIRKVANSLPSLEVKLLYIISLDHLFSKYSSIVLIRFIRPT